MSSCPGSTLESYVLWEHNLLTNSRPDPNASLQMADALGLSQYRRQFLDSQQFKELMVLVEPFREDVENRLEAFDEMEQSWRGYCNYVDESFPASVLRDIKALLRKFHLNPEQGSQGWTLVDEYLKPDEEGFYYLQLGRFNVETIVSGIWNDELDTHTLKRLQERGKTGFHGRMGRQSEDFGHQIAAMHTNVDLVSSSHFIKDIAVSTVTVFGTAIQIVEGKVKPMGPKDSYLEGLLKTPGSKIVFAPIVTIAAVCRHSDRTVREIRDVITFNVTQ